jgi:hypothetical protein
LAGRDAFSECEGFDAEGPKKTDLGCQKVIHDRLENPSLIFLKKLSNFINAGRSKKTDLGCQKFIHDRLGNPSLIFLKKLSNFINAGSLNESLCQ